MNIILLSMATTIAVSSAAVVPMQTQATQMWSEWGPWSPCSAACTSNRVRKCKSISSGSQLDLSTLLLLGLGGSSTTTTSSSSSLLPLILSGGSMDPTTMFLLSSITGSSTTTTGMNELLPIVLSGGMGGNGAGSSDMLMTYILLSSLSGNSTSTNDFLPILLAGQSGTGGGASGQDSMMTLLLLTMLSQNSSTSGINELLPFILSSSSSDQNTDMTTLFLLMGMSGNNTGLDPIILYQLLGQGSSSKPIKCSGYAIDTKKCYEYPCVRDNCLTQWGSWSECSATCGSGTKRRIRECICRDKKIGYGKCTEPLYQTTYCIYKPCEQPTAQWEQWTAYSKCVPSGTKCSKIKTRSCTVPKKCAGPFKQSMDCDCPSTTKKCVVSKVTRKNCGVPGITKEDCERKNCCFDSSEFDTIWCFYPSGYTP